MTAPSAAALAMAREGFAPCPTCRQYSHSIGEDQIAKAFRHFQGMFSHRDDGIPTQFAFDQETRDAAQVLVAALSKTEALVEALRKANDTIKAHDAWHAAQTDPDPEHGYIPAHEYADSGLYERTLKTLGIIDNALALVEGGGA